ncbi:hypothetical protein Taro_035319 [Colocasia esculenta]|uniref:Uncharacterized protein n=1 Tax=Colocasia esculenta TaxID=4460 RepID=A0A843WA73_COLES|nr:hypothetical protein [Colocasia esculenta]
MTTPNCCFGNPFLGAIRGGTGRCSSLTSWSVRGAGWFCLWALDLVEVRCGRACGETSFSLGCLVFLGVTPGCSFLTSWRSGMLVLRHETLLLPHVFDSTGSMGVVFGLTRVVVKNSFASALLEFLLLWLVWVSEVVEVLFRCGPANPSHCLTLRWFNSHVGRSGVGPQLGRAAVVCGCVLGCDSLALLYRGGCRRESAASELEEWTMCPTLSYLWWWLLCSYVTVCVEVFASALCLTPLVLRESCLA